MLEGTNIKLSGTITDINGKSARNILETILGGTTIDEVKISELKKQKLIARNLKATDQQLVDDLNGFITPLQHRMLKELLSHLVELNVHISSWADLCPGNNESAGKRRGGK